MTPIPGSSAPAPASDEDTARSVETLVRERLGCTCEPAVFRDIRLAKTAGGAWRIAIGGRLLIELVEHADGLPPERIEALLTAGRRDRDALGMNRFRLVLGGDTPVEASAAVRSLLRDDPRLHLHWQPTAILASLCRRLR
jgi:hypothetical protein